jgi:hypothetical protein
MNEQELNSITAKSDDPGLLAEFEKLAQHIRSCAAFTILSEKWNFLGGHDNLLRIDMLPLEFVAALQPAFTVEELTELGLYERVGDELRLPSWLDGIADLYVRISECDRTIVFSSGNEFLFPMQRTALSYALERIPPDSTHGPISCFLVESPDSVKVMHRLGLASVSSEGLNAIDSHDVLRLFDGDLRSDCSWRHFLLLVDFDVACLENRPLAAMEEVINRLADAQDVYGFDPSRRFGVCRPTAFEFQALERATAFKDAAQIRQVFENWSTAAKRVTVGSWRSHFVLEVPSFAAARTALTDAIQLPNGFHRQFTVQAALPAYRAASKGPLMQKFYHAVDRASDPFDHFHMMAAADYAESFLDNDPLVRAAEVVLAGKMPPSARELQEESFDQRQRCMAELRRICRDLKGKR